MNNEIWKKVEGGYEDEEGNFMTEDEAEALEGSAGVDLEQVEMDAD